MVVLYHHHQQQAGSTLAREGTDTDERKEAKKALLYSVHCYLLTVFLYMAYKNPTKVNFKKHYRKFVKKRNTYKKINRK